MGSNKAGRECCDAKPTPVATTNFATMPGQVHLAGSSKAFLIYNPRNLQRHAGGMVRNQFASCGNHADQNEFVSLRGLGFAFSLGNQTGDRS